MTRLPLSVAEARSRVPARHAEALRFDLREFSGSLGDLGTFLPIAVALALTCGMDIGLIFIFAGLMNIATGVWFRQPIPVQPMKAIAAVAIAEGLTAGAIASAGVIVGSVILALAMTGGIDWLARAVPKSVVRGIQAGVGIKLAFTGVSWLGALPPWGWDSWAVAGIAALVIAICAGLRQPGLLYIFIVGMVLLAFGSSAEYRDIELNLPTVVLVAPGASEWWTGLMRGAIPQIPLTLLNSVIAVCALSADYYPRQPVAPRRMATSVGLMNLLCVPFGGMPMCHGAGGLAAQHRFGARTGGSVVMLGAGKVLVGLLLGGGLIGAAQHYPMAILSVMVVVAGLALAWAARDALEGRSFVIVMVMLIISLVHNTLMAFLIGSAIAVAFAGFDRYRAKQL